jgi:hypothetical protein
MCFWKPRVSELYSTRPIFCEDWHCIKAIANIKRKAVDPHRIVFMSARYQQTATAEEKKPPGRPAQR